MTVERIRNLKYKKICRPGSQHKWNTTQGYARCLEKKIYSTGKSLEIQIKFENILALLFSGVV